MTSIYRTRVSIIGGIGGSGVSTMHWGLPDSTSATALSTDLQTFWTALANYINGLVVMSLDAELEEIETTDGHLVDVHAIPGWSVTGASAGEALPWATQGLCKWRTGVVTGTPAKEIRGRTFVPGMTESNSTSGRPTSGLVTAFSTAQAALINLSTGQPMVIYSPKNATAALVTSGTTWSDWASLRSRRD